MSRSFTTTKEENQKVEIETIIKNDKKFLDRKINSLKEELEDAEEALTNRLKTLSVIDESVVEVMYSEIKAVKSKLNLYTQFKKDYIDN